VSEVRQELRDWVASEFPGGRLTRLAGDASARAFLRLTLADGTSRVVMDYGRPFDGETDDIALARLFRRAGLPVAEVLDVRPGVGCLLLEDLGDLTLEQAARRGDRPLEELYGPAIELAIAVAVRGTPVLAASSRSAGPALDAERFRFETDFFVEHYVGAHKGLEADDRLVVALGDLADATAAGRHRVLCHRDFHSRNLMLRPDGSPAMVDIQDARWGPDTYDVASLLCDAYVDLDADFTDRMLETFRLGLPEPPEPVAFRRRYDLVAAQRMLKALGTFGYQAAVVGHRGYLEGVPRTLARLDDVLPRHPETAGIHALLDRAGLLQP
jgi:aminoglycoside/choline kinase family phosphotransferase